MNLATFTAASTRYRGATVPGGIVVLSPECPQWRGLRNGMADE